MCGLIGSMRTVFMMAPGSMNGPYIPGRVEATRELRPNDMHHRTPGTTGATANP